MKIILTSFLLGVILYFTQCNGERNTIITHKILKEEVYDKPIKTQITSQVLIESDSITKGQIRELLTHLHSEIKSRTGFQYHDSPTSIYIYAYSSKEKYEGGMGQWIGMSAKSHADITPTITISDIQFKSLNAVEENKFGLTDNQRVEIWKAMIKAEDRAQKEADEKYPTMITDLKYKESNLQDNMNLSQTLTQKYHAEVISKYHLDEGILDSIGYEGITKGWPFPAY